MVGSIESGLKWAPNFGPQDDESRASGKMRQALIGNKRTAAINARSDLQAIAVHKGVGLLTSVRL